MSINMPGDTPAQPPLPDPEQRRLTLVLAESLAKVNGMMPSAGRSSLMGPLEQALVAAGLVLVDTKAARVQADAFAAEHTGSLSTNVPMIGRDDLP